MIYKNSKSGFTLIELMVVILTLGILASTAMAAFSTYQARTKASEASLGLNKMTQGEVIYYQRNNVFLAAGPINIPPGPTRRVVAFAADNNWKSLSFDFAGSVYFGYQATITSATQVACKAMGDLDGDGVTSLYERDVTVGSNGSPIIGGMYYFDELE